MKFKIGDKIRTKEFTEISSNFQRSIPKHTIGIIREIRPELKYPYSVQINDNEFIWTRFNELEIELIN